MTNDIENRILTAIKEGQSFNYNDNGYSVTVHTSDNGYDLSISYDSSKDNSKIIRNAFDNYIDALVDAGVYGKIIEGLQPGVLKSIDERFNSPCPEKIQEAVDEFTRIANTFVQAELDENYKRYKKLKSLIIK